MVRKGEKNRLLFLFFALILCVDIKSGTPFFVSYIFLYRSEKTFAIRFGTFLSSSTSTPVERVEHKKRK